MPDNSPEISFERAFGRLEEILQQLNSGSVSLDASLKLYEEADRLIRSCSQQLSDAEKKIEILIKNRSGQLALDANQQPIAQEFSGGSEGGFQT